MRERNGVLYDVILDYPKEDVRFIDFTPTLLNGDAFYHTIQLLKYKLSVEKIDYIIAPEARGFIWGSALASATYLPIITVRKKDKLPIVGQSIVYDTEYSTDCLEIPVVDLIGKKVLYVDDVYATGGTYEACKELVRLSGGILTKGLVLYNVGLNDNDEIISLFKGDEL